MGRGRGIVRRILVTDVIPGRGKSGSAGMGKEDEVEGRELVKEEGFFQGGNRTRANPGIEGKIGVDPRMEMGGDEKRGNGVGRQGSEKVRGGAVGGGTAFRRQRRRRRPEAAAAAAELHRDNTRSGQGEAAVSAAGTAAARGGAAAVAAAEAAVGLLP